MSKKSRNKKQNQKFINKKLKKKTQKLSYQSQKLSYQSTSNKTSSITESTNSIKQIYYSIYRGYSVNYTACFFHPIYALVWMRWMLWKDMILHLWTGDVKYPLWHFCVGTCEVEEVHLKKIRKHGGIWGDFTRKLFMGVSIYRYMGDKIMNNNVLKSSKDTFEKSLLIFKEHADYQQSAGSIFKNGCIIKNLLNTGSNNFMIITKREIHINIQLEGNKFIDIGGSAREMLKDSANNMNAGM